MKGISKSFPGVTALGNADLEVEHGEIRALLGENGAGKTTLMNILYGLVNPDSGAIEINGQSVTLRSPADAIKLGIGMVHQHFMLVPVLSVAENVALGLEGSSLKPFDLTTLHRKLRELSDRYGLGVDPSAVINDLSIGMKQRVEILKLLYRDAHVLIFDEPTASLSPPEWNSLRSILRTLAATGRAIVLITHKLDEVLTVAERCTVMRRGHTVSTVAIDKTDKRSLARAMIGHDFPNITIKEKPGSQEEVLWVQDVHFKDEDDRPQLRGLTFSVRQGEIVGIAGVDGNGQQQLVEVLSGVKHAQQGEILLKGERITGYSPKELIDRGVAIVTEDRHSTGVVLNATVFDNLIMKELQLGHFCNHGIIHLEKARRHCRTLINRYNILPTDENVLMRQLSGGNQQKVVLGRELSRQPQLLIASQPTRGLDVGAIQFMHERLVAERDHGCGVLLISNELDEVLTLSDRVAVMVAGRFTQIFERDHIDMEALGLLMAGEDQHRKT